MAAVTGDDVLKAAEAEWYYSRTNNYNFIIRTAGRLGVELSGSPYGAWVEMSTTPSWNKLSWGPLEAAQAAAAGQLVIAGVPRRNDPFDMLVVMALIVKSDNPLFEGRFPYAYWGASIPAGVVPQRNKPINALWPKADPSGDVVYMARVL